MKLSEMALLAADLYDNSEACHCCEALSVAQDQFDPHAGRHLYLRFQHEFAERTYINADGAIDDMNQDEIDQFRVFLLLMFSEWLKDRGE